MVRAESSEIMEGVDGMPDLMALTLDSIQTIDGRISELFTQAVQAASIDCMERAGDDKARTIQLITKIKPVCDARGDCDMVAVEFEIQSKVPASVTRPYQMIPTRAGIKFNPRHPTDINQPNLDFEGPVREG